MKPDGPNGWLPGAVICLWSDQPLNRAPVWRKFRPAATAAAPPAARDVRPKADCNGPGFGFHRNTFQRVAIPGDSGICPSPLASCAICGAFKTVPPGNSISGLYPSSPNAPGWKDAGGNPFGALTMGTALKSTDAGKVDHAVDDRYSLDGGRPSRVLHMLWLLSCDW